MLKAGDKAPGFTLHDDAGNTVTLKGLLKNGPLLLYFYPADLRPAAPRRPARSVICMKTYPMQASR